MFLVPIFGLYAANQWSKDRDLLPSEGDINGEGYKTYPFGLEQSAFQSGNARNIRWPRQPMINQTTQPLKYDPPGQVGAGRSSTIMRDNLLDEESHSGLQSLANQIYFRDIPFTGWNNSNKNWRIQPQARSWPRAEIGAEVYVPKHFDAFTGSGFGDLIHDSPLGAQHYPKEIFSQGPVSFTNWAHMVAPGVPLIHRNFD